MSNRAEGCGQWLSAKDKRSMQLPTQKSRGGKKTIAKHKSLLNFATSVSLKRSGGLNIQVSCSPLSPRSRKKLKTAKQSKINNYFASEARSNGSKREKKLEDVSGKEGCFEGKKAKISVKRQRNESPSVIGYSTEAICSQEKDNREHTDLNISGISQLDDSFEDSDKLIETNSPSECVPDKTSESSNTNTVSPPRKKFRTSKTGESLMQSSAIEQSQSPSMESEGSRSFRFCQWKKEQMTKCKEVQDESPVENSPFTDASGCDFSQWKKEQIAKCNEIQDESSLQEDSPFIDASSCDLSQWKKDQLTKCKEIQDESSLQEDSPFTDASGCDFYQWKKEQIAKCNEIQDESSLQEDSPFTDASSCDLSQWKKDQLTKCKEIQDESSLQEDSPFTDASGCDLSQWKKDQLTKCKEIQDESSLQGDSPFRDASGCNLSQWKKDQLTKCNEIQDESSLQEDSPFTDASGCDLSQWKKDQLTKCKEIQDESSVENSPFTDARDVTNFGEESDSTPDHRNVKTAEFSETPPFQFTQWANKQVKICRKIQRGANEISTTAMEQSRLQNRHLKPWLKDVRSEEMGYSEPQSPFSDRAKIREKTSSDLHEEIQGETESSASEVWECETWDDWTENEKR